jgi:osmotically-inducible protein OsmY
VNDGIVELWGFVDTVDQHSALRALVEETNGVRRLEDKITVGLLENRKTESCGTRLRK